jgi:hypothetical protein
LAGHVLRALNMGFASLSDLDIVQIRTKRNPRTSHPIKPRRPVARRWQYESLLAISQVGILPDLVVRKPVLTVTFLS